MMKFILILFVFISLSAEGSANCQRLLLSSTKETIELPAPGSEAFEQIVKKIKDDFEKTHTFSIVDFRPYLPQGFVQKMKLAMNKKKADLIVVQEVKYHDYGVVSHSHFHRSSSKTSLPELQQISLELRRSLISMDNWFERLIYAAFPILPPRDEPYHIQVRSSRRQGIQPLHHEYDEFNWHPDGGTLNVIVNLEGSGTLATSEDNARENRSPESIVSLEFGHALVFAGSMFKKVDPRIHATYHATPSYDEERMFARFTYFCR